MLGWKNDKGDFTGWNIPKYKVGEVVAIAQSYETIYHEKGLETLDMLVSNWKNSKGWRNKMFVRSDLMSHHIRIANIKIQRLERRNRRASKECAIWIFFKYRLLWAIPVS